ncbi:MAG: 2-phosphosulfolactate phosphatase [Candidatus Heimdallarchaeota archaeon]|nr:2-phosphosulfolactate phosphatase [Candidatus Heimdallarchaeota archaeon]
MKIRVISTFSFAKLKKKKKAVFVVIDTFRATSSIVTMMNSGASRIFVTDNGDNAKKLKALLLPDALLIGESKGIMIEGFDYGNTPSIFSRKSFKGKEIIFTSSSGAKAITGLKAQNNIFIGSLLNLNSVITKVAEIAKKEEHDIFILPSGSAWDETMYVIEDWLTGILMASNLSTRFGFVDISEGNFYSKTKEIIEDEYSLSSLLKNSPNGQALVELGFADDVDFAVKLSKINDVPKIEKFREMDGISFCVIS